MTLLRGARALAPFSRSRLSSTISKPLITITARALSTSLSSPTPKSLQRRSPTQSPTSYRSASTSAQGNAGMYTASSAFFEALWETGVTHCFVNLGSDHPSIIEAIAKAKKEGSEKFPKIITCPNEMVALSMADGYARLTNKPQAVLVHVDVGTQGFGAGIHNASTGRAPVLMFAGLSPFTLEGEMRGSRTEFIHWIQDVPDQKAIVAQYCRYSAEIKTGRNIKQMVGRAMQFAKSEPRGPVYLCAAREVMEEDVTPKELKPEHWEPVELGGLPTSAASRIADALAGAKAPLLVTGYSGRNHKIPSALVKLADTVKGLRVLDCNGSDMSYPANHPAWAGLRYGNDDLIRNADVIVVLDCDTPWITAQCKPREDAQIFHIDVDPLKQMMPLFYINPTATYKADALTAVEQLTSELSSGGASSKIVAKTQDEAGEKRMTVYKEMMTTIAKRTDPLADNTFGSSHLTSLLRKLVPDDTIFAVEAVTNTVFVSDALQPTHPGQWINCGGGGLGWSGGGALGIKMATDAEHGGKGKGKFVVQIVADGSFMFSVPSSVYWIANRYEIPILTVVLNNNGWHAPRRSLLLVHPEGLGSKATNSDINLSFEPSPDYAGIAKAASNGGVHGATVDKASELEAVLKEAIEKVKNGQTAVVDCKVVPGC